MSFASQILSLPEKALYQVIDQYRAGVMGSTFALLDSAIVYGESRISGVTNHLHGLRFCMTIINAGWMLLDIAEVTGVFKKKNLTIITIGSAAVAFGGARFGDVALAAALKGLEYTQRTFSKLAVKLFPPQELPEELKSGIPNDVKPQVHLSLEHPHKHRLALVIYLGRILLNIAKAYRVPESRLLCGVNVLANGYSFLQTYQLKWLRFSREVEFPQQAGGEDIQSATLIYQSPLIYRSENAAGEKCYVCQEENPEINFCPNTPAPLHLQCLINYFYHTSEKFKASPSVSNDKLPQCLQCRTLHPNQIVILENVTSNSDKFNNGTLYLSDTSVPWPSEAAWATLNTIYAVFQSAISAMSSRHPELIRKIFSIQRLSIPFDTVGLAQNYYQLYQTLYKRYVAAPVGLISTDQYDEAEKACKEAYRDYYNQKAEIDEYIEQKLVVKFQELLGERLEPRTKKPEVLAAIKKYTSSGQRYLDALKARERASKKLEDERTNLEQTHRGNLIINLGVATLASGVITLLAIAILNRVLRPSINLTEILKKVVTPADFEMMKIQWSVPWSQFFYQWLCLNRIVMSLALSYFSQFRKTFLANAFFQTVSLLQVSKLKWISIDRKFERPNGVLWDNPEGEHQEIERLKTSFSFVLPPNLQDSNSHCSSLNAHIETHLRSMYDFTTRFFEKSIWKGYFYVTTRNNNLYVTYNYDVDVHLPTMEACSCQGTTHLDGFEATAYGMDDPAQVYINVR